MRSETRDLLSRVVADLPEKEQQVLALYYCEELTMKQIGALMGIGESRVSQVHTAAVIALRARLAGSGGDGANVPLDETKP
jgi:RNA polymerase sigma factor for flagellar operon FliA